MVFAALTTVSAVLPQPGLAQDIIRCPDWQSLVAPVALRASTERVAPGAFEAKLTRPGRTAAPSPDLADQRDGAGRRRAVPLPSACTHTIRAGDTLGRIAARNLGSAKRWPQIARANPGLDPKRLRIGAAIRLPCGAGAGQGASVGQEKSSTIPASTPGAPLSGTGFLAALFGTKAPARSIAPAQTDPETEPPTGPGKAGRAASPADGAQVSKPAKGTKATKPAKDATPPPAPLPVWSARAGEDFEAVLRRWGRAAGYRVVVSTSDAWILAVPVRLQAEFEAALNQLVQGLGSDGTAPPVRIYSNRTIRLGGL
ncbi:TcpQ domain-containing protein [Ruegeria sp.]|uniref:TcpQ domain-containing protein n=1 Tax=Ruegeria sp. TaxID=1879320 RepID=UPI003AFF7CBE